MISSFRADDVPLDHQGIQKSAVDQDGIGILVLHTARSFRTVYQISPASQTRSGMVTSENRVDTITVPTA